MEREGGEGQWRLREGGRGREVEGGGEMNGGGVRSESGEGGEGGKGARGSRRRRGYTEGETHLTDKPRRHPGNDDSSMSYPTLQTDSRTALPLIHCTSQTSSRFALYLVHRGSGHYTWRNAVRHADANTKENVRF